MATATPERVSVEQLSLALDEYAWDELRSNLQSASAAWPVGRLEDLDEEHPALMAWEKQVVDSAIEEIMPAVADLLHEAINKRLPWTWEPER